MMSTCTGSPILPMTGAITIRIDIGTRTPVLAPCKAEWRARASAPQLGVS
jgi:hypothetical protein